MVIKIMWLCIVPVHAYQVVHVKPWTCSSSTYVVLIFGNEIVLVYLDVIDRMI